MGHEQAAAGLDLLFGAVLFCAAPVLACDLPAGETATVASVVD